jgi:hypothetical protein
MSLNTPASERGRSESESQACTWVSDSVYVNYMPSSLSLAL